MTELNATNRDDVVVRMSP